MNNRGFSLVELIIVIAIISILVVVGISGITYSQRLGADKCAQKIASVIEEGKGMAMSKYEISLIIQNNSTGEIEAILNSRASKDGNTESISSIVGDKDVMIKYETASNLYNLTDRSLTIVFDRKTGAFDTESDYCEKIYVEKGGVTRTITLEPKTGKVSIE